MPRRKRRSEFVFAPRRKEHHFFRNFLIILLVAAVALVLIDLVDAHQISYQTQYVTVADLPDDLENWTILCFSDLHGEELGSGQSEIASRLGTVSVSSVVFAGDMLSPDGDVSALLDLAALIPSGTPMRYLPGDEDPSYLDSSIHSALSPYADWALKLQDAGITILDEPILYTRGKKNAARIWFVPENLYSLDLDSFILPYQATSEKLHAKESLTAEESAQLRVADYQLERVARIRESIASMLETDIQIAVTHVPLTESYVRDMINYTDKDQVFSLRNVSLVLAGHLCAGQLRIPFGSAVYVEGYGAFPEDSRISGLRSVVTVPQYISPGLGASGVYPIRLRLFNSPGFTKIALTSKLK